MTPFSYNSGKNRQSRLEKKKQIMEKFTDATYLAQMSYQRRLLKSQNEAQRPQKRSVFHDKMLSYDQLPSTSAQVFNQQSRFFSPQHFRNKSQQVQHRPQPPQQVRGIKIFIEFQDIKNFQEVRPFGSSFDPTVMTSEELEQFDRFQRITFKKQERNLY